MRVSFKFCAVIPAVAMLTIASFADSTITHINPDTLRKDAASSHAVVVNDLTQLLHIAGQTAINVDFEIDGETLPEQLEVALQNFDHALKAGNARREDVVQLNVFFVDPERQHIDLIRKTLTTFFAKPNMPAVSYVGVPMLVGEGMLIEIEGVAVPNSNN